MPFLEDADHNSIVIPPGKLHADTMQAVKDAVKLMVPEDKNVAILGVMDHQGNIELAVAVKVKDNIEFHGFANWDKQHVTGGVRVVAVF